MAIKTHGIRVSAKAYQILRRLAYKTRKPMIQIIDEHIISKA